MLQEITLDILLQRMQVVKFLLEKLKKKKMSVGPKCAKISSRKPIKTFLHFKMLTLQNVKFKMSEYSNTTYTNLCTC